MRMPTVLNSLKLWLSSRLGRGIRRSIRCGVGCSIRGRRRSRASASASALWPLLLLHLSIALYLLLLREARAVARLREDMKARGEGRHLHVAPGMHLAFE